MTAGARPEAGPRAPVATPRPMATGAPAWWRAGLAVACVGWGAQQFAPLLLLYRHELGVSTTAIQATFGTYVLGLIPGLLLGGPVSDQLGRRRVMLPALAASVLATGLLMLGGSGAGWLFAGRLVAGVASGAAFSSGAAWVKELSAADSSSGSTDSPAPRRMTVAMSVGFGVGPLVAGGLAQWAPAPTLLPYLPHLALAALAVPLVWGAAETRAATGRHRIRVLPRLTGWRGRRFWLVVVPLAPWVFGSAAIALAYLPGLVADRVAGHALVFSAAVTALTAGAGIAVQPLARRADQPGRPRLLVTALGTVLAGMLTAAMAATTGRPSLVVTAALVLGAGYGCCQVCGLREVQRLAEPTQLGGLTAAYQAVSYLGFAAPYPLAAAAHLIAPGPLLLLVAGLAGLTLLGTARAARRTEAPVPEATGPGERREHSPMGARTTRSARAARTGHGS